MPGDVLLGIDLGTTVLKAAAFDARSGRALGHASVRLPVESRADGAREQRIPMLDRALMRVADSLRRQLGGAAWRRVAGIGLAAQGGSAIIADRSTGRALTPMQLWNDSRAYARIPEIAARKPSGYWPRFSFLRNPGAGLARIEWLRDRLPQLFCPQNIYVGAGEYVYFRLTGTWRQDAGNALQIGCYDARRHRIIAEPLRLVGAEPDFVAPMRSGHEMHPLTPSGAKALRLPAGIPVAGPYMDHEAGYLSAMGTGAESAGGTPLQCSLGTAWVGNFVSAKQPPPGFQLMLPSPIGSDNGRQATGRSAHADRRLVNPVACSLQPAARWLVVRVMCAGNITWDWALGSLLKGRPQTKLSRADAVFRQQLLPPAGLAALPWFTRANPLAPDQAGAGFFAGLGEHTTTDDMLRAVVAGMCFEFARVFQPVVQSGCVDRVVLGGGASNGWYFRTMLAGLFAPLPVFHVQDEALAGTRGVLYAFNPRVAATGTMRVPRPGKLLIARIQAGFDMHRRLCDALAGGLPEDARIQLDIQPRKQ